ncbi:carph-isopro domain-containing protein [uncultured Novosphingobium sp.]|uniref:carph-isopro domain-containing protein n=1 Tax=uncultured Novosphingobium sp. TaxID=292277 RepID=UPI00259665AA|nr:hypothetical protein [uncultured Novosphingobium sp.]
MQRLNSIFDLFGGIRPMARHCDVSASNVAAWKRENRIPAAKQAHVLTVGLALGLPITLAHVVFPSGQIPAAIAKAINQEVPPIALHGPPGAFVRVAVAQGQKYGNNRAILDTCSAGAPA